jgi:hypothetical protein
MTSQNTELSSWDTPYSFTVTKTSNDAQSKGSLRFIVSRSELKHARGPDVSGGRKAVWREPVGESSGSNLVASFCNDGKEP